MKTVLTIAGFDPSSGAGITADLAVFAAHRLFGTSCITALTVQSTVGVQSSHPVTAEIVGQTLSCLDSDLAPAGIKLGMLASAQQVEAVADYLEMVRGREPRIPVVLDPVILSSSGRELLTPEGLEVLQSRLLGLVDWITPNLAELSALTGRPVERREDVLPAARALHKVNPRLTIFATGGHLSPPDDLVLLSNGEDFCLLGERIATRSTHGTGCVLSSALLSHLVLGDSPRIAAEAAKAYVSKALRTATPIGHGHGPLNYLWPLLPSQRR
jgi:hydroxymethylpyrimidine/phosphomethylpyrimidine kinase